MANYINQLENRIGQPYLIFNDQQTVIRIIVSAIIIYIIFIILVNLYGKRSIANLSMHDYVVTIAMGSIVASTILSKDASLFDGFIGILTLLSLQWFVTMLSRYDSRFFRFMNVKPRVLFIEGKFIEDNMKTNRVTQDEIYSVIREQGQTTSDQIYAVILESNGNLSVIKSATDGYKDEITRYL